MSLISKLNKTDNANSSQPVQPQGSEDGSLLGDAMFQQPHAERKEKHPKKLGIRRQDSQTVVSLSSSMSRLERVVKRPVQKDKENEKFKWQMSLRHATKSIFEDVPPPRKRADSMDSLFQHSWDYSPYYWDPESYKRRKNSVIPPSLPELSTPREMNEADLTLEASHHKKERTKKKLRFADDVKEINRESFITDVKVFASVPFQEKSTIHKGLQIGKNSAGQDVIEAGTSEKLVSLLADQSVPVVDFIKEFLLTFRIIMGPIKLLTMLIDRFDFQLPENPTEEDIEYHKKYEGIMKLRVINVLKKWLQNHYYDFAEEKRVFKALSIFIEEKVARQLDSRWSASLRLIIQEKNAIPYNIDGMSPLDLIEVTMKRPDSGIQWRTFKLKKDFFNMCLWGEEFIKWIQQRCACPAEIAIDIGRKMQSQSLLFALEEKDAGDIKPQAVYRFANRPLIVYPKSLAPDTITEKYIKFLDIHPKELARQLTLISQDRILRITSRELTELVKSKCIVKDFKVPCIGAAYSHMRSVINWVATEVLCCDNMSLRTAVIARWIAVAEDLKELNNISDVYAIVKGVEHKSVKRLAKTWKNVPKKTLKSLEQFKAMLEPVVLRHSLSSLPLPYLPPLQFYIDELAALLDLPDTLENGMINFSKLQKEANVFDAIERPIPRYIQHLMEQKNVLEDEYLEQYSLSLEAKSKFES